MKTHAILVTFLLAACATSRSAPKSPAVQQLEAELAERPGDPAVMYALAMFNDRAGEVDAALTWLARVAETGWENGLDPGDFPRAGKDPRFPGVRAAVERRWQAMPTAVEVLRIAGERDLLPEGMEVLGDDFLLSSGKKRKVVRVSPDGSTRDLVAPGQDGLLATLGLRVHGPLLWVASTGAPFMDGAREDELGVSRLHAFDLATGVMKARFERPAPSLFNDVAVLPDGRAVVTDTVGGMAWIVEGDRLEPFVPAGSLADPNGICVAPDGASVYVATWTGIVRVEVASRRVEAVAAVPGIDGLYWHDGALVGIQNAVGRPRVVRVSRGGAIEVLESGTPVVDNPTTGAFVADDFVFLARRNRERGGPLEDIVLAKVPTGRRSAD